jgi:hypothetical protein
MEQFTYKKRSFLGIGHDYTVFYCGWLNRAFPYWKQAEALPSISLWKKGECQLPLCNEAGDCSLFPSADQAGNFSRGLVSFLSRTRRNGWCLATTD